MEFTKGDYQEAWKASLEALKADPRDRKANLTAARAELQLGSYRNAKTRIEQILSLNPHQYDARMLRAEVFQRMGDLEAALASPEGRAAVADVPNFATGGATFLFDDEVVLIPCSLGG